MCELGWIWREFEGKRRDGGEENGARKANEEYIRHVLQVHMTGESFGILQVSIVTTY